MILKIKTPDNLVYRRWS